MQGFLPSLLVTLAVIILACAPFSSAEAPTTGKVSASIRDTTVDGLEGLNINIAAPFKVQDYVVGFKYWLGDLKKAPESLFARKTFDTFGEGSVTFDADFNVKDNVLDVEGEWNSKEYGLNVFAKGDTANKMNKVEATKDFTVDGKQLSLKAMYDFTKKMWKGAANYKFGDGITFDVECDSDAKDPRIELTKEIDDQNEIAPAFNVATGKLSYGYKRKWAGGFVKSTLSPGEKIDIELEDNGSTGTWKVNTAIPLENDAKPKVSITRDWIY